MVNGRNKGRAFELSVAKALFDELGVKFSRDLRQYQEADHGDLICDDPTFPFSLELKRYAQGYTFRKDWWQQCRKAAEAQGKEPALVYKYDRMAIQVVLRMAFITQDDSYDDDMLLVTDWPTFMQIVRETWNDY
jgi:hypothetical protein